MSRFPSDPTVAVRSELPPGPALPGWEVARQWIERPVEFWEECGGRFGDTFTIELGSIGTSVLFSHPEAVREIFDLSPETYEVRPYNGYSGTVMGDRAIFRTDGAEHRRKRRLIIPQLTRRSVDSHRDAARRLVRELIDSWETGQIVSPRPALHLLTLKFILEIGLGTLQSELAREVVRNFLAGCLSPSGFLEFLVAVHSSSTSATRTDHAGGDPSSLGGRQGDFLGTGRHGQGKRRIGSAR